MHVHLGLHVLARGVIFVDLALAQVAALGLTVALLAGHSLQGEGAYGYALAFAVGGAVLFALTRTRGGARGDRPRPRAAGRRAHQAAPRRLYPHRFGERGRRARGAVRGDRASPLGAAAAAAGDLPRPRGRGARRARARLLG